jgi:hypothetical protein
MAKVSKTLYSILLPHLPLMKSHSFLLNSIPTCIKKPVQNTATCNFVEYVLFCRQIQMCYYYCYRDVDPGGKLYLKTENRLLGESV